MIYCLILFSSQNHYHDRFSPTSRLHHLNVEKFKLENELIKMRRRRLLTLVDTKLLSLSSAILSLLLHIFFGENKLGAKLKLIRLNSNQHIHKTFSKFKVEKYMRFDSNVFVAFQLILISFTQYNTFRSLKVLFNILLKSLKLLDLITYV